MSIWLFYIIYDHRDDDDPSSFYYGGIDCEQFIKLDGVLMGFMYQSDLYFMIRIAPNVSMSIQDEYIIGKT